MHLENMGARESLSLTGLLATSGTATALFTLSQPSHLSEPVRMTTQGPASTLLWRLRYYTSRR